MHIKSQWLARFLCPTPESLSTLRELFISEEFSRIRQSFSTLTSPYSYIVRVTFQIILYSASLKEWIETTPLKALVRGRASEAASRRSEIF